MAKKHHPLRNIGTALAAYTIGGFLTYGWLENHVETGPCDYQGKHYDDCTATNHESLAVQAGIIWPVVPVFFVIKGLAIAAKAVTKWP